MMLFYRHSCSHHGKWFVDSCCSFTANYYRLNGRTETPSSHSISAILLVNICWWRPSCHRTNVWFICPRISSHEFPANLGAKVADLGKDFSVFQIYLRYFRWMNGSCWRERYIPLPNRVGFRQRSRYKLWNPDTFKGVGSEVIICFHCWDAFADFSKVGQNKWAHITRTYDIGDESPFCLPPHHCLLTHSYVHLIEKYINIRLSQSDLWFSIDADIGIGIYHKTSHISPTLQGKIQRLFISR